MPSERSGVVQFESKEKMEDEDVSNNRNIQFIDSTRIQ